MKRIGVFTSGGDSPGMNACIRAVVRAGVHYNIEIIGIHRGYQGMIENEFTLLNSDSVANIIQHGGTILKTARSEEFKTPEGRQKAYNNLIAQQVDGLICIGGDGTYTGAMLFEKEFGIPSIGCPGTIDNDLFGTDFTIGFDTAANTAVQAIDKIRDTAASHDRIFFVEVMGRHSGYLALYSGIAGGAAGTFLPERSDEFECIVKTYRAQNRKKQFSIFIVAEGDEEGHAFSLSEKFKNLFPETDTRVVVLGHIQRGGNPTVNDRVLATRLGAHAVKALLDGKRNMAAGVVSNQIVFTSFEEAISKTKDIPEPLWILNQIVTQ